MPEGDTILRAARTLQRALAGGVVTRFTSVYPALTRIDHARPLTGRTIQSIESHGKHILMTFSGDLVLRTHMRMHGSWHLYRPGERWHRPARDMRILIVTAAFEAVGFNIPDAEFITARQLATHAVLSTLGPDLASPDFDRDAAARRLRERAGDTIETALLDQRAIAGIGNVLKSETLFVAGVHPFARVADLDDETIGHLLDVARRLMKLSTSSRDASLSPAIGRRTTGSLDPDAKLWVYGRGGKPCRKCGTPISSDKAGRDARLTYWCSHCQPEPAKG